MSTELVTSVISSSVGDHVAELLLELKAVSFSVDTLFNYVSGIQSPVYVDNRKLISHPRERKIIVRYLVDAARKETAKSGFDVIAGTATAGIPWASWVADEFEAPLIYVRPLAKDRGLRNQIEGLLQRGQRTLIIEDLITTGLSSSNVAQVIRSEGGVVDFCLSIFSFAAPAATARFQSNHLKASSLTTLANLVKIAKQNGHLDIEATAAVEQWSATKLASFDRAT